jgi:regulator of protease activity HflC (stomatin/prohibitin superfamily)
MDRQQLSHNKERERTTSSGWLALMAVVVMFVAGLTLVITAVVEHSGGNIDAGKAWAMAGPGLLFVALGVMTCFGFFTLEPNETRVCVLFGAYKGTARQVGFRWANPFYSNGPGVAAANEGGARASGAMSPSTSFGNKGKSQRLPRKYPRYKISVRARTLNGPKLKVNDRRGNPVEIATVVVWRVNDTAQAVFDVDDFEQYVETQSETALRHLASSYAYDHGEEDEITLRSNVDEVSQALKGELEQRLVRAGVVVEEARLSHLAYAPEIAQAMLRRQQAEAVIDARQKIVHGAVSMVEMALRDLTQKGLVDLDAERKAAMVSNLMVVLCGESEVHPVVNTGTLYT